MPEPKPNEEKQEFISRCIEYVMDKEGLDKDQAAGKCYGIWREHEKKKSGKMLRRPIAAVEKVGNLYKGYAVLWGDPENRDLYRTYFRADGEYCLDWYKELPWLYHHGMNSYIGAKKIGTWKSPQVDERGIFYLGELDLANEYAEQIKWLIEDGVLKTSSGSLDYLVEIDEYGGIKRWPIVELSATVAPADIRMDAIRPATLKALRSLDKEFGMSVFEQIKEKFSRAVEEEEEPETEVMEPEPEPEPEPEEDSLRRSLEDLTAAVEQVAEVVQQLDEAVKRNAEDLAALRAKVVSYQERPVSERLRSLLTGEWTRELYVASRDAPVESPENLTPNPTPQTGGTAINDPVAAAFIRR